MSLTTKAIHNLAVKQNKARSQGNRLAVIVDLVIDLGWDRDNLSEDGQRIYDELCEDLAPTNNGRRGQWIIYQQ